MKKTIFAIDDDPVILDGIQSILEEEGYRLVTITNPPDLKTKLKTHKPDLILLDYMLEGNNGVAVAREIKNFKDTKNIPIILISGSSTTKELAHKAGAVDFIVKPFEIHALVAKVNKYLKS